MRPAQRDKRAFQLREQGYRDGRAGRDRASDDNAYWTGYRRGLEARAAERAGASCSR